MVHDPPHDSARGVQPRGEAATTTRARRRELCFGPSGHPGRRRGPPAADRKPSPGGRGVPLRAASRPLSGASPAGKGRKHSQAHARCARAPPDPVGTSPRPLSGLGGRANDPSQHRPRNAPRRPMYRSGAQTADLTGRADGGPDACARDSATRDSPSGSTHRTDASSLGRRRRAGVLRDTPRRRRERADRRAQRPASQVGPSQRGSTTPSGSREIAGIGCATARFRNEEIGPRGRADDGSIGGGCSRVGADAAGSAQWAEVGQRDVR